MMASLKFCEDAQYTRRGAEILAKRKQAMTTVLGSFHRMKNVRRSVATSRSVRILLPATETAYET